MYKIAVLDDGDCTTWASDALIIEVPTDDFESVFENGKECRKYLQAGKSAKAAVESVLQAKHSIEEKLNELLILQGRMIDGDVSTVEIKAQIAWLKELLEKLD